METTKTSANFFPYKKVFNFFFSKKCLQMFFFAKKCLQFFREKCLQFLFRKKCWFFSYTKKVSKIFKTFFKFFSMRKRFLQSFFYSKTNSPIVFLFEYKFYNSVRKKLTQIITKKFWIFSYAKNVSNFCLHTKMFPKHWKLS